MSDDPYKVLAVAKDASQADIKTAYRKLAKSMHLDLHPGDMAKAAGFQAVAAAYEIIGDADKRKRFDAGEIDASGQEKPQSQYYREYADADPQGRYDSGAGYGDFEALSDVFSDLFGTTDLSMSLFPAALSSLKPTIEIYQFRAAGAG